MDDDILKRMVEEKLTVDGLEEIRQNELKADPDGEAKIMAILAETGSMVYRDLRRKSRIRQSDSNPA